MKIIILTFILLALIFVLICVTVRVLTFEKYLKIMDEKSKREENLNDY